MNTYQIGVRELRDGATQVVRSVRETHAEYVITLHGEPVAVIRPFTGEDAERIRLAHVEAHLESLRALAAEVGAAWTSPSSGVELVEAQRRG